MSGAVVRGRRALNGFAALMLGCLAVLAALAATPVRAADESSWQDLRPNLFGDRTLYDGSEVITIIAPYRASDASLVPVEIRLRGLQNPSNPVTRVTLVVDENPAPVAAVFDLEPDAQITYLSTRLRVNAYGYLRVIAETKDGSLYMHRRYVKASGGCSAPASKNADKAMAGLGQMRMRYYPQTPGGQGPAYREAQLQIRHPNFSGLQMDQVTGLFRPAYYVSDIEIKADDRTIMKVQGAISLSENPVIRFRYVPLGSKTLRAHIEDTEGKVFDDFWQNPWFGKDS